MEWFDAHGATARRSGSNAMPWVVRYWERAAWWERKERTRADAELVQLILLGEGLADVYVVYLPTRRAAAGGA